MTVLRNRWSHRLTCEDKPVPCRGPEHQILLVLLLSPPECPTGCERPPRRCRPSISPIPITTSAFGSSPLNLKQSKKKAKKPAPVPILAGHVHHRPLPSRGQPRRPAH
ncbi:hypothetical protein GW17_00053763, partial [Ensete ventricosum]